VYKGRIPQVGLDGITKKLFISILTIWEFWKGKT
jgi:hypothetical protein